MTIFICDLGIRIVILSTIIVAEKVVYTTLI